ncbi:MAG: hypothetical protein LQ339_000549 [Xanthoria mediterranea]|nr:MAG: hypothetical protein LQ339_000549 [Xanthoria mediterranea]
MATRPKRRRLAKSGDASSEGPSSRAYSQDPSAPATNEERSRWKGFCEIESEPAFFNVMLRDFGVEGVRVQEVVSLDPDMLAYLPRPVYGLVFLFKWREEDPDKQEPSCPEGIWFANQTVNNACASVALLNIVNNIPELKLSEHLEQFKKFTADFTPALRGDAIGNFEFVKTIHNSFARKMDMLNADLQLKNDASARKKSKAKDSDEDDAGFHFIAFIPVQDKVWKLDGLERQPQNLGPIAEDDWVLQVAPEIETRMAQYEDGQIEFAILSLVREPLIKLVAVLAENVKSITSIRRHLLQIQSDRGEPQPDSLDANDLVPQDLLLGPSEQYRLSQEAIDQAVLSPQTEQQLKGDDLVAMSAVMQQLSTAQTSIRASIRDEISAIQADDDRAASRRNDKGLLAKGLLQVLERMGRLSIFMESACCS